MQRLGRLRHHRHRVNGPRASRNTTDPQLKGASNAELWAKGRHQLHDARPVLQVDHHTGGEKTPAASGGSRGRPDQRRPERFGALIPTAYLSRQIEFRPSQLTPIDSVHSKSPRGSIFGLEGADVPPDRSHSDARRSALWASDFGFCMAKLNCLNP